MTTQERIEAATFRDGFTGCWLWSHARSHGYGNFQSRGAHRVLFEILRGKVPKGLDLDHLCRNRACVNPDHLEPVTRKENLRRGATLPAANAIKTHCPRGHAYDASNTYFKTLTRRSGGICRCCRACNREKQRERRKTA
jgi:hypothetical protein